MDKVLGVVIYPDGQVYPGAWTLANVIDSFLRNPNTQITNRTKEYVEFTQSNGYKVRLFDVM